MKTAMLKAIAGTLLAWSTVTSAQTMEPSLSVFTQREQWIAAFQQMPPERLRTYFLRCDRESRDHLLELDAAVRCAMAWDALLQRAFAGDVEALLAWWREQVEPPRQDASAR